MISIIIPVYNQAEKLIVALKSIAVQSYQDYEVIIVNDGSTDNPEQMFTNYIKKLDCSQRYVFLNQENHGAPAARNRGLREAGGEFLFFCDADAVLKPIALDTMLAALQNEAQAAYAYSSFYWGRKFFQVGTFDQERLQREPYIHTMSLIRRSDFPETGWDESIKKFQDWDLWLTMLAQNKHGVFIPQALFTVSPGGTISSWLPSFAYQLLPFLPAVKKYQAALKIIKEKHGLL